MRKTTILLILIITLSTISPINAQNDINPISLELKIYTDGSVLIDYLIESDPSKVRIDIDLFGEKFNNIIIRDEEKNPLGFVETQTGITVDSIGASELRIIYSSHEFTSKDGPIWDLNISSPIATKITLPVGAVIFDLSDIPVDIGIIDGTQFVVLPPGELFLSFIHAISNQSGEAQAAIDETYLYIESLKNQGYLLTEAQSELTQAQEFFDSNQFKDAKEMAIQAKESADETVNIANSAAAEIDFTHLAIDQAKTSGRTNGIEQAEKIQSNAATYYTQGQYIEAETMAKQASQLALNAEKPSAGTTFMYLGLLIVVIAILIGYYFMLKNRQGRSKIPVKPTGLPDRPSVDLEKIFDKHDTLRLEDREVIKFLAENNGEAFATEIRERFDLPRSSAWRLIRRLVNNEIVDEIKIGNQSLIRIKERYHV